MLSTLRLEMVTLNEPDIALDPEAGLQEFRLIEFSRVVETFLAAYRTELLIGGGLRLDPSFVDRDGG
jgi:hypothetical protein